MRADWIRIEPGRSAAWCRDARSATPTTVSCVGTISAWSAAVTCLGLREPEPEVGQAGLFIALEACDLHLRRQARLQFRNQLHSPNHLRHQPALARKPKTYPSGNKPHRSACSLADRHGMVICRIGRTVGMTAPPSP